MPSANARLWNLREVQELIAANPFATPRYELVDGEPATEWSRLRREGFPARVVLLAIEVLSRSSARIDRVVKRRLYQRHVPEYWIIDLHTRAVERWRSGNAGADLLTETRSGRPRVPTGRFT